MTSEGKMKVQVNHGDLCVQDAAVSSWSTLKWLQIHQGRRQSVIVTLCTFIDTVRSGGTLRSHVPIPQLFTEREGWTHLVVLSEAHLCLCKMHHCASSPVLQPIKRVWSECVSLLSLSFPSLSLTPSSFLPEGSSQLFSVWCGGRPLNKRGKARGFTGSSVYM